MKRFIVILSAALFICGGMSFAGQRPNVLVILVDDLGYSDLGCYGGEIETPNIDRLASGGARFSSFYNSARCCPSRAALMTGLHPHQAGIGSFAYSKPRKGMSSAYTGHLLPTTATLAELLGDAGYSTWMVGKWHMGHPGPIARGFQNYFGFKSMLAHSGNQWKQNLYARLPEGTQPELKYDEGEFFATDVFTDYTLEFLKQARTKKDKPWFLYLAHSAPHFPVQAPIQTIDKYMPTYRKGWDILRAERFNRQKKLGLVDADAVLPPRSQVPVDRDDIANGYSGKQNPAWESLPVDRREDLARRGATFAAMVEHVDRGVGKILNDLEKNGELENTLILFTSDNGACYEWGPFGFDGRSRQGKTTLHKGEELRNIGQADTHHSYGSGWANLGNTPLTKYKHFCHEGGISSPMIAHWPIYFKAKAAEQKSKILSHPGHIMDIVPTVLEATGVSYPRSRSGKTITPVEGTSLLPAIEGKVMPVRALTFEHQKARALRKGDWKIVWGKRQPEEVRWELYNLKTDRFEQHNVADQHPEMVQKLVAEWEAWAKKVGAEPYAVKKNAIKKKAPPAKRRNKKPNIITVFIDDMGWSDISCFGGDVVKTENIDRLANEGIKFKNFYVNSPICSPSRAALTTGQYPQRWRISSYLSNRKANKQRGMAQWLDPKAPILARELQKAGYYTAHCGKWHMGGQRDVGEAPLISEYGFDRSLTNFEGLGPRVLPLKDAYNGKMPGRHALGSDKLGRGPIRWMDRSVITSAFVKEALLSIDQAQKENKPFFINVWPDDVHSPFFPPDILRKGTDGSKRALYYAVLDAMDQQLGVLFDRVRNDVKLKDNTLIIFASDNGHEEGAGKSTPLRGAKTWLYEGGVRSPLIVWGPGMLDEKSKGLTNETSILCALDINVSLYELAGIHPAEGAKLDGERLADTLLGKSQQSRKTPIFWRRPPDRPGTKTQDNPDLSMREGKWKFYINYDGSDPQLYDLDADIGETRNLNKRFPSIVARLTQAVFTWNKAMPRDAGDPSYTRR